MKKFLGISICILILLTGLFLIRNSAAGNSSAEAAVTQETEADVLYDRNFSFDDTAQDISAAEEEPDTGEAEITAANDSDTDSGQDDEEEQREILPEFNEVLGINPYVSAWLNIEGSDINAPVVYTPRSQNYFLHRALDGSEKESGTLFIAVLWRDGYNNTLVYGHNMKDGSGFGSLGKFSSADYGKKHSILKFDTLYEEREYELLGVFYSSIEEEELETEEDRENADKEIEEESIERKKQEEAGTEAPSETPEEAPSEAAGEEAPEKPAGENETPSEEQPEEQQEPQPEEPPVLTLADLGLNVDYGDIDVYREEKDRDMERGDFRYYYFTDLTYKEDYDYFVEHVKEASLYDTGVDAEWGDELLTLSTCSYHTTNGRFIVVAKRRK